MAKNGEVYNVKPDRVWVEKKPFSFTGFAIAVGALAFTCLLVVVFTHFYFGEEGVRLVAVIVGVSCAALLVWAVTLMTQKMTNSHTQEIVRSVTQALIDVQTSDDKGEVARVLATLQDARHDSEMSARRMFTTAVKLAESQKGTVSNPFDIAGLISDDEMDDDEEE